MESDNNEWSWQGVAAFGLFCGTISWVAWVIWGGC
jgi:hypothetical protein